MVLEPDSSSQFDYVVFIVRQSINMIDWKLTTESMRELGEKCNNKKNPILFEWKLKLFKDTNQWFRISVISSRIS